VIGLVMSKDVTVARPPEQFGDEGWRWTAANGAAAAGADPLPPVARSVQSLDQMRVLEARFHPQSARNDFVVIAHVVWQGDVVRDVPKLEPTESLRVFGAPSTMLAKLSFLVATSMPEAFTRLQSLKSQYWSFVEIDRQAAP
jgi:hypothetical protein